MILVLYREDIRAAVQALAERNHASLRHGCEDATKLHFEHILRVMEKKELQAVAIVEHG